VVVFLVACSWLVFVAPPGRAGVAATTTFADEFSGPAGSAPDNTRWNYDVGGVGWGKNELQAYTSSTENASHDGKGHLLITARTTDSGGYTSSRIVTRGRFYQAFGHFEARLKMPVGAGLWPAFWLLGSTCGESASWPRCGEIDVVENRGESSWVSTHAHGPRFDVGKHHRLERPTTEWHVYAVTWAPNRLSWSIDGEVVQTLKKSEAGRGWVFHRPFIIILNLAVGGHWPGAPTPATRFPAEFLVDHVRVTTSTSPPMP
jgi:beta-glucanase (GH16 family)